MNRSGFSLPEILTVIVVLGSGILIAAPIAAGVWAGSAMRSAAHQAALILSRARMEAIRSGRQTAVRVEQDASRYRLAVYQDGNGDGVRNAEIAAGTDYPLRESLTWIGGPVRIGILQDVPVPDPADPSRTLQRTADPVRFNNSNLCSFSPFGESTPGSIYFCDGHKRMSAVRVYNRTAKIRILYFTAGDRRWTP